MKIKAAYTRLLVTNLEACFQFYRDLMEFPVKIEAIADGYAEFAAGEMRLALFRRQEMAEMINNADKPADARCQDKVVLIFTIHDLDEAYNRLRHQGIKFTAEPIYNPSYGIKTAYLRDPDQNLIGLFQPIV